MRDAYRERILQWFHRGNDVSKWLYDLIELKHPQILDQSLEETQTMLKKNYFDVFKDIDLIQKIIELIGKKQEYQQTLENLEVFEMRHVWFMNDSYADFDLFDSELYLSADSSSHNQQNLNTTSNTKPEKLNSSANFHIYIPQKLPFCFNIIQRLLNNSNIRQKLYQTCKHFWVNFNKPMCYGLNINDQIEFSHLHKYSIFLLPTDFNKILETQTQNPGVMKKLTVVSNLNILNPSNRKCFSQTLGFMGLEIKYLALTNQDLTFNDIDQLINQSCDLVSVHFNEVKVFTCDGGFATAQAVVRRFHRVKKLTLRLDNL